MPHIEFINSSERVDVDTNWTHSHKQYDSRKYELIKEYRDFSSLELLRRKFLGVLIIVVSFGLVYLTSYSSHVKQLFTKISTKKYTLLKKIDKRDPVKILVDDMLRVIFKELGVKDLGNCGRVSKDWARISSDPALWLALPKPRIIIRPETWTQNIPRLKIEEAPALPPNIYKIIRSPCPFSTSSRIDQTHKLIYLPEYIGVLKVLGDPNSLTYIRLTLNNLSLLINHAINQDILEEFGDQGISPGWYLMLDKLIEKTVENDYQAANLTTAYVSNLFLKKEEVICTNSKIGGKFLGVQETSTVDLSYYYRNWQFLYLRKL